MTKAELRREMRERLRTLGPERQEKSRAITQAIAHHPAFRGSGRIGLFSPLPSEPDVEQLWEDATWKFCYPRILGPAIEFVEVQKLDELSPATWHRLVREPAETTARVLSPAEIDLLLVPGVAFTRDGLRLGRGGGFYDRFLASLSASTKKLGVCFDLQIVSALPVEAHDQRVDALVTESGLIASSN